MFNLPVVVVAHLRTIIARLNQQRPSVYYNDCLSHALHISRRRWGLGMCALAKVQHSILISVSSCM